ncbi:DNA recombination protein RmuC [Candidatus Jorgensenbacteria bacterium CG_4_10_14_0_8_um_filter_39_13]|uniref:DNA recombination protein RmuC n=2 Tax=Candidatus Joergenseniibacteriota TaxID=1752739 RepID=A0A2M7RHI7_9BACT|nr:MAG: DNA recombination protein RmuC [Candidatus Jorgensenbacteria bacterium CG11_big_fil_rev_8_21_14_0_20_38_23]PIV12951.1 MAG: DNA recombination protein RmuC [Candidatus Jorgensenbacteria bacterium CG03_land_8_20_14_0_80_38_39]PIW97770.1 MAG: DNA recombination protein RmuC [Candidatus Jorgensenbacteria bacterium CG_4_8_14_3_um_filter_38_10]PIY96203.1 MAG: DNA recombination protein RmuC [Candidatus Jorgensenbacteria bacterium CG_4_10_14_0_8_um_filter_39_13]PJA95131.1 MAG: DNA recombination p
METILFIIILLVLIAGFVALYFLLIKKNKRQSVDEPALIMLQNQISEINRTLDTKISESTRAIQQHYGESAKIIRDVTEKLVKLDETNKQVINFADQLKSLQDILRNPKQRGVLGEYYLKTVLENILPPGTFKMQYEFKDGTIVDAVIFLKDRIIPIDSKFSLENYNRLLESRDENEKKKIEEIFRQDLKNRIDETSKYIKPSEKTMDFAFMFIPAEAIYYDLLINKVGVVNARDLVEYAFVEKKVIVVSPTTFFAYLQSVLQGLKALQIEESAKEIRKRVEELGRHLASYDTFMKKLGSHLGTSVGAYNSAYKELGKIDKDILKITGEAVEIEPLALEEPIEEE